MSIGTRNSSYDGKPEHPVARILYTLRRSFFLSVFVLGIVIAAIGLVALDGVLSGMFGIWGGTMVLVGGGAWVLIFALRQ